MVLLDKLLPKLKERDSRVLIFSQVSIGLCWLLSIKLCNACNHLCYRAAMHA